MLARSIGAKIKRHRGIPLTTHMKTTLHFMRECTLPNASGHDGDTYVPSRTFADVAKDEVKTLEAIGIKVDAKGWANNLSKDDVAKLQAIGVEWG